MKTIIVILLFSALAGILLLPVCRKVEKGKFETHEDNVHPPAVKPPEAPCFLTFRSQTGILHIRADRIRSFAYDAQCRNLIINDGQESPAVISDPRCRYYARLCERFGTVPMMDSLKGARK